MSKLRIGDVKYAGFSFFASIITMSKIKDLTGQRFGRLVVIYPIARRDKLSRIVWRCQCDGGKLAEVRGDCLKDGTVRSCGCLLIETARQMRMTHGETANGKRTRLYTAWMNMKRRCSSPAMHNYKQYGERGIVVCNEWRNNYPSFKIWALANGYADNLTIDRINSNGNYEPLNCQWITKSENSKKPKHRIK